MDRIDKFKSALALSRNFRVNQGGAEAHVVLAVLARRVTSLRPLSRLAMHERRLAGDRALVGANSITASRFHPPEHVRPGSSHKDSGANILPRFHFARTYPRIAKTRAFLAERLSGFSSPSAGAHEIKYKTHIPMRPAADPIESRRLGPFSYADDARPGRADNEAAVHRAFGASISRRSSRLGPAIAASVAPPALNLAVTSAAVRVSPSTEAGFRMNRAALISGALGSSIDRAPSAAAAEQHPRGLLRASAVTAPFVTAQFHRESAPRSRYGDRELAAALGTLAPAKTAPVAHIGSDAGDSSSSYKEASSPIVINSSPTVVVQAGHRDLGRQVLDALRRYRRELFDEMQRELRVRMRTDF